MPNLKKLFTAITGYWIHKQQTLPIGVDMFYDITRRVKYGNLKLVFDVGANEGQTLKWVKHHQPNAQLVCFEPVSSPYKKLLNNSRAFQQVTVENFALGDKEETVEISLYEDMSVLNSLNPGSMNNDLSAPKETIQVKRLDEYCEVHHINRIDLLKIDTEGYELQVLDGASKMLDGANISFIYCETGFTPGNQRNTYFPTIIEYLEKKGYFFYSLYQIDAHDWKRGNHLANALFIHQSVYP